MMTGAMIGMVMLKSNHVQLVAYAFAGIDRYVIALSMVEKILSPAAHQTTRLPATKKSSADLLRREK